LLCAEAREVRKIIGDGVREQLCQLARMLAVLAGSFNQTKGVGFFARGEQSSL
jgi:hypothetical protein